MALGWMFKPEALGEIVKYNKTNKAQLQNALATRAIEKKGDPKLECRKS